MAGEQTAGCMGSRGEEGLWAPVRAHQEGSQSPLKVLISQVCQMPSGEREVDGGDDRVES